MQRQKSRASSTCLRSPRVMRIKMSPYGCLSLPSIIPNLYTILQNRHQGRSMSASSLFQKLQCPTHASVVSPLLWPRNEKPHVPVPNTNGGFQKVLKQQNMERLCFLVQNMSVPRDGCALRTTLDAYKAASPPPFLLPSYTLEFSLSSPKIYI